MTSSCYDLLQILQEGAQQVSKHLHLIQRHSESALVITLLEQGQAAAPLGHCLLQHSSVPTITDQPGQNARAAMGCPGARLWL